MHVFCDKFNCGGNTQINPRTHEKYDFLMQENGIQTQSIVIVDYATAKIIQNVNHIMSIHFNNDVEKYGLKGSVFKDTNTIRKVLARLNSEELIIKK